MFNHRFLMILKKTFRLMVIALLVSKDCFAPKFKDRLANIGRRLEVPVLPKNKKDSDSKKLFDGASVAVLMGNVTALSLILSAESDQKIFDMEILKKDAKKASEAFIKEWIKDSSIKTAACKEAKAAARLKMVAYLNSFQEALLSKNSLRLSERFAKKVLDNPDRINPIFDAPIGFAAVFTTKQEPAVKIGGAVSPELCASELVRLSSQRVLNTYLINKFGSDYKKLVRRTRIKLEKIVASFEEERLTRLVSDEKTKKLLEAFSIDLIKLVQRNAKKSKLNSSACANIAKRAVDGALKIGALKVLDIIKIAPKNSSADKSKEVSQKISPFFDAQDSSPQLII